jgi:hypothetical protein
MRDHPLVQLTLARAREFYREPEAVFWVFGFPVVLAFALGIAFRSRGPDALHIGVVRGPGDSSVAAVIGRSPALAARVLDSSEAQVALRAGHIALLVLPGEPLGYRYDTTRAESRLARLEVDDVVQRARGRRDPTAVRDERITTPGSRYIDFLIPGLPGYPGENHNAARHTGARPPARGIGAEGGSDGSRKTEEEPEHRPHGDAPDQGGAPRARSGVRSGARAHVVLDPPADRGRTLPARGAGAARGGAVKNTYTRTEVTALLDHMHQLEDELIELRKWPTTVADREGWLRAIVDQLVEAVDDVVTRSPETAPPEAAAIRELTRKRGDEIAYRAARKPDWWRIEKD